MSNPTLDNSSQFNSPYNILPDVIYTNPTKTSTGATLSQFTTPYNILPDSAYQNPTETPTGTSLSQFTTPYNILPDTTYQNPTETLTGTSLTQFNSPYNILPDTIYTNPTKNDLGGTLSQFVDSTGAVYTDTNGFDIPDTTIFNNPTTGNTQFNAPFNILPDSTYNNPTVNLTTGGTLSQFVDSIGAVYTDTNGFDILPNFGYASAVNTGSEAGISGSKEILKRRIANTEYSNWQPQSAKSSNITVGNFTQAAAGTAVTALGSVVGIPQISQLSSTVANAVDAAGESNRYLTADLDQLNNKILGVPIPYVDFRSRRLISSGSIFRDDALSKIRVDGASAATRGSIKALLYSIAAASPAGAYTIYNLDGFGNTGYGLGTPGDNYAIRNDFTLQSHASLQWHSGNPTDGAATATSTTGFGKSGKWKTTTKFPDLIIPFRGDRVNVIDFGEKALDQAYTWKRQNADMEDISGLSKTQDFIKFYFTGPKLFAGSTDKNTKDDIIVFRAIITSLQDTFSPQWQSVQLIGRADPNYHLTEYSRELSLDFIVQATDRDEMQPIWRKLNALAGYTAPKYNNLDLTLNAPIMRITIGDLFVQQPVLLNSLRYTLHDNDTTWEINIEDDPTMMQAPQRVTVSCGFHVLTDYLPQHHGRFYTLAKEFVNGIPSEGKENWLSDFLGNSEDDIAQKAIIRKTIERYNTPTEE